jgi:Xaa-Pro aminopeptidase
MMDYTGRRDRLRGHLREVGVAALVVTTPSNVRYLTGFTGSNGAVVVSAVEDRLCTDSRYYTQAARECPDLEVLPTNTRVIEPAARWCADEDLIPIGYESGHLTVRQLDLLKDQLPSVEVIGTADLVEGLRAHKDADELALIRRACSISDAALARLLAEVRVGVTERALAGRLSWLMREEGADGDSFESIIAGGPNSAIPHHTPTDRPLEAGDLLKIDFGALFGGYHADETRTFVVGAEPTAWQAEIHQLVALAQRTGVEALRDGATCAAVDSAARSVIVDAGYGAYFGHGLGHAVGLDIHEVPFLGSTSPGIVAAGTPITVEPGIYIPGSGGVRIEDTLVVGLSESVPLTTTTRELLVLGL